MPWFIPLLIFLARICDVSIGTMRMILVISGHKYISALLGFVEVIIWVLAVGGAIKYLHQPLALLAYAGGFASGTLVGMWLDGRIALGYRVIRVINANIEQCVSTALRQAGFRVTRIEGSGMRGPVEIAFLVIRRRALHPCLQAIRTVAPDAFVSVERADHASGTAFNGGASPFKRRIPGFNTVRK